MYKFQHPGVICEDLSQMFTILNVIKLGNSLAVQQLVTQCFHYQRPGLIPGQGTKIAQAAWHGQKKKKKKQLSSQILGSPYYINQSSSERNLNHE